MKLVLNLSELATLTKNQTDAIARTERLQVLNEALQTQSLRDNDKVAEAERLLGDAKAQITRLHSERETMLRSMASGAAMVDKVALVQPILEAFLSGSKTDVIRVVRDITGLGLSDAKLLVEGKYVRP